MAVSISAHSAPKNREMFAIKKSYSIEVSTFSNFAEICANISMH